MPTAITEKDKAAIEKYFGMPIAQLDEAQFKKLLRELRSKYHPDNFEKFGDETVREMATERFQQIEMLAQKMEAHFAGQSLMASDAAAEPFMHQHAVFAANQLKVEVITTDKDLKYKLFGTMYRWLQFGDSFKIPDTGASIIMDENHQGLQIGYQESIRMYLTFEENDSIEKIVAWLYPRIKSGAKTLLIAGERTEIEPFNILYALRKRAFQRVELPAGGA
ncbi:MAG TPA: hypothetical protein PKC76_03035 [Saprospiraceae bacterium]|nr:hypothetical protein [Saprospiraceae bacterium]HMP23077.1 hypothetical protein [Saprospiraceae bacterium]